MIQQERDFNGDMSGLCTVGTSVFGFSHTQAGGMKLTIEWGKGERWERDLKAAQKEITAHILSVRCVKKR